MAFFKLSYCVINTDNILCHEIEKQSLLSFKQSLQDPNKLLYSWDEEVDCCKWKGVVCNNSTGHVHQLRLQQSPSTQSRGLSGKINPSLLNLKHLRYLDLSGNSFGETIPSFVGSFAKLEHLNLSNARFHGKLPISIGNLTNLRALDLGGNEEVSTYRRLKADSLEWLTGLSELEYLNMNLVDLSVVYNWPQVINSLPSLQQLHLYYCFLHNLMAPLDNVNMSTSLARIDLSFNQFRSFANLSWVFRIENLRSLDLSRNILYLSIPTISNATKLQYIDLSYNNLNSSIPDWFYFCNELEFVSLSYNLLQGTISNAIANLTSLDSLDFSKNELTGEIPREITNLCRIRNLDLSFNKLQGEISDSFGDTSECFLGSLRSLSLQTNNLSGHLTEQLGEFQALQSLDVSENLLSGVIPESIGKLSCLEFLSIEKNMLEGVVSESHFANLKKLQFLYASMNPLTLNISSNWTPPFELITLGIGSWNLGVGSQIPSWIEKQKNISYLDLYNTGITGGVPDWFWKIAYLDLSNNCLTGEVPEEVDCSCLYLSSNKFSGSLPRIRATMRELDLSNNSFSGGISRLLCDMPTETNDLNILHLGKNQLSGELPDCWMKWSSLVYLNIGNNNISGNVPSSIAFLALVESLNLDGNKISGQIPISLRNCTKLVKIDLSDNGLSGSIPTWVGTSLYDLKVFVLRSNKLSGKIPSEICRLNSLQILDLANNQFSGRIPKCVYNFTAMATKRSLYRNFYDRGALFRSYFSYFTSTSRDLKDSASVGTKGTRLVYDTILSLVTSIDLSKNNLSGGIPKELTSLVELRTLNLSENNLTGVIPYSVGNMKELESLDLSRNSLSGQIPSSFNVLSSLAYLNISCNNLTGKIPESTQLLGFNASSFTGNNLCGPPLTSDCSDDGEEVEENEGDESKIEWFYVVLSLGYAVGFSVVCTTLVLKKSWKDAYFGLFDSIWDKVYVYVCTKWRRLTFT